jgi:hypothetical protein
MVMESDLDEGFLCFYCCDPDDRDNADPYIMCDTCDLTQGDDYEL